MFTQGLEFLKSDVGKRIVGWVLSSGVGLVILGFWVYSLTERMGSVENKLETVNTELKTYYRNDRDTLIKTLTETNGLLRDIKNQSKNDKRK
jgi:hypothetical protein